MKPKVKTGVVEKIKAGASGAEEAIAKAAVPVAPKVTAVTVVAPKTAAVQPMEIVVPKVVAAPAAITAPKAANPITASRATLSNEKFSIDKTATVPVEQKIYKGGAYKDIKVEYDPKNPHDIDRHHIPADSIMSTSRSNGPAIQMDKADHIKTSSYGNSAKAQAYRQKIKTKIESGDIRGAVAQEGWDVKNIAGTKYNDALREMIEYGKSSRIIPRSKK
jgi:hypothetical protein